ncbi:MAG: UDP-N-acetylglucosamine 1-carboxyvinyltransferase [Acidobacteria bacterium]|nr:UDP-N-acetylglucosamine 1-carboxyvinyltransferase [Acidobacteriota bacterium]MCB9377498.1 UDP-N-acetylglucosamine 1-carboxyvinyltransferase [Holophagales bacterium]
MDQFRIVGPSRLVGRVGAGGAKNAALPALAASLLTDAPVELERVPRVRDVETMRRLLAHLGRPSEWRGAELALLPAGEPSPDDAPYELVKTMRASVLVLGPLVARRGHGRVSLPGGCAIGVRPVDQHLAGLEALGAEVTLDHGYVDVRARQLVGGRFRFAMPTVTGTENLLMAAALARGETRLDNCAREPEVVDLARLLCAMGARVEGAGEESIVIEGVDALGGARHRVIPDRIEGGTYLIAAALTGGDVELEEVEPAELGPLLDLLRAVGAEVEAGASTVRVRRNGPLAPRDVVTAPHPGFPTDLQAQYMTLMTQAAGVATISETIFENRMQHVAELARMGADIRVDGNLARVHGPTPLAGATVMATDLRASASLVLAGLVAEGETRVDRIYHLDRGYEAMERKLNALGARVERLAVG